MKNLILALMVMMIIFFCSRQVERRISAKDYVSKMKAGWIGQMAGVGWGGPTEFRWKQKIIPADSIPQWQPAMVNQFNQDDIYVEMTFLRTLEKYGFDVSIRQAGIDFANSRFMLWAANKAGRDNLRAGVAPPWSGHPQYNAHADDIDYQIEADYAGLISPGMPQACIDLGEKFGRIMNYGDGLYGGQFVSAMYSEAFFENDVEKIVAAGLRAIPQGSQYYEAVSDVVKWHKEFPKDWRQTWQKVEDKYQLNPDYRKFSSGGPHSAGNIDAKLNGAYIVMGLLYGEGDLDKTITVAMRCGQDSDCNPSNAAGILATTMGYENLPEKFTSALDYNTKFSYTDYDFTGLIEVCQNLARNNIERYGGRIDTVSGEEVYVILMAEPKTTALEQSWQAKPLEGDPYFTETEMAAITVKIRPPEDFIKSWQISGPYLAQNVTALDLLDHPFPPEHGEEKWQTIHLGQNGLSQTNVQFHDLYGGENRAAYARTRFYSPKTDSVVLELGSDDGVKVWFNGEVVHRNNAQRGCSPGEDSVPLKLKKGWNELLIKVTQGLGGWELTACLADKHGEALKDLKFAY